MRAVWLDVPEGFLEERRRLGHDKRDELWDGELHMVPPGTFVHGFVINELLFAMNHVARRRGMRAYVCELGVFQSEQNYRVPDLTVVTPSQCNDRGLSGAELVVEVLSPNDESRLKQAFYAARGIRESWLVEPRTRGVEVYQLEDGRYVRVASVGGPGGIVRSPLLDITLAVVAGPKLRIVDGDYVADV